MSTPDHELPNLLGVDQRGVSERIEKLIEGYGPMGSTDMGEHATHSGHLPGVGNTLPMMTGTGPYGAIEMGGMFTIIKIREGIGSYEDLRLVCRTAGERRPAPRGPRRSARAGAGR